MSRNKGCLKPTTCAKQMIAMSRPEKTLQRQFGGWNTHAEEISFVGFLRKVPPDVVSLVSLAACDDWIFVSCFSICLPW